MAVFSCYVDVERFLGLPVKNLANFLICLSKPERFSTITVISTFFQHINSLKDFKVFSLKEKENFFSQLKLDSKKKEFLWKLLKDFFFKQSENSSGKYIPQDDLISLRKGRLFEELVYNLGPIKPFRVELTCMHCQPMINRRKLKVCYKGRDLSHKNIDVVFWGRNYVEGFECKGNAEFFIRLAYSKSRNSKKAVDKLLYLHLLAKKLRHFIPEVRIYLASFATKIDLDFCNYYVKQLIQSHLNESPSFKIITLENFLKSIPFCENSKGETE